MNRTIVGIAASVAFLITASTSAVAQTAQTATNPPITVNGTQPAAKKAPDPNEVICEKQQDTSSRLVTKRVCMTRSQWAEQRRLDRQDIEKIQTERPMSN